MGIENIAARLRDGVEGFTKLSVPVKTMFMGGAMLVVSAPVYLLSGTVAAVRADLLNPNSSESDYYAARNKLALMNSELIQSIALGEGSFNITYFTDRDPELITAAQTVNKYNEVSRKRAEDYKSIMGGIKLPFTDWTIENVEAIAFGVSGLVVTGAAVLNFFQAQRLHLEEE